MPPRQAATRGGTISASIARLPSACRGPPGRCWWAAGPGTKLGTDPDRPEALPYSPGNRLGDLVLAAQQNVGRGTVVVLGAAACLSNDGIPFSYTFTGPLLCVAWPPTPDAAGLVAAVAGPGGRGRGDRASVSPSFEPLRVAAAGVALALAMLACSLLSNARAELLPPGHQDRGPADRLCGWLAPGSDGQGSLGRERHRPVNARAGPQRLLAAGGTDLSPERLNRAAMLISIAPGRAFSSGEIAAVDEFVDAGRFLPEHGRFAGCRAQPGDAGELSTPHQAHARAALGSTSGKQRRRAGSGIPRMMTNRRRPSSMPPGPFPALPAGKPGRRTIPSGRSLPETGSAKVRHSSSAIRTSP